MLKELLTGITDLAQKAAKVDRHIHITKLDGKKEYLLTMQDGGGKVTHEARLPDHPPRRHALHSVSEIGGMVEHFHNENPETLIVAWIGREQVTIVIDDDGFRENKIVCPQTYTPEFSLLTEMREQEYTQKELVRLLRVDMATAETESSAELLRVARVINTKVFQTGHGVIEKTRASLGKDIEAEVRSDAGDIPDEVKFRINVYDDPALQTIYSVTCRVEIDPQAGTFFLLPVAKELQLFEQQEKQRIRELLQDVNCPVFLGEPVHVPS